MNCAKRALDFSNRPLRSSTGVAWLTVRRWMTILLVLAFAVLPRNAHAAGSFKLKSTEAREVSGAWHIFVTLELARPPATPHVPMKFVFTKTAVFERALVDGSKEPVTNRQSLQSQLPSIESLDVDFADGSGKIFKATRFDFGLTRARGYEAGEYKMQVRTADGVELGRPVTLVLKGDNPVVDRRSMNFSAKEPGVKKVDPGAAPKQNAPETAMAANPDVEAVGTPAPFIPPEAYEKTPEEQIKERPKGCGCTVPGGSVPSGALALGGSLLALVLVSRRRSRA